MPDEIATPGTPAATPPPAATPTPADLAAQLGTPAAPVTGTPAAATPGTPAAGLPAGADVNSMDISSFPPEAQEVIRALRTERGDERQEAKRKAAETAQRDAILALARANGIDLPDDTPVTVDQLQERLATQTSESTEALSSSERSRAIALAAWQQGLQPEQLDYLEFQLGRNEAIAKADPKAAGFGATLATTITGLMTSDPALAGRTGSATRLGVESLGGPSGTPAVTPESFAQMSTAQKTDLYHSDPETYTRLAAS